MNNRRLMLKAIVVLFFWLPAVQAVPENSDNQEKLVAEFVEGLMKGCEFKEVEHLFLSAEDFPDLVKVLKSGNISERRRRQLEGERNLRIQKQEMSRQIKWGIVQPWNTITSRIKDDSVDIKYNDFRTRKIVRKGITTYKMALKFVVIHNGYERKVEKTIKVMDLGGGKLKIVELFRGI